MSLIDRANEYLKPHPVEDQAEILRDCVESDSSESMRAVQLLYENMYGGATYNMWEKAPPAYTLLRWGTRGLEALIESAEKQPTFKNQSLTITILLSLVSGNIQLDIEKEIKDKELVTRVFDLVDDWEALSNQAHQLLHSYILSLETDTEVFKFLSSHLSKFSENQKEAREVFAALASRFIAVGKPVISGFKSLIKNHANEERLFQEYFERYPQLLDPMAHEVWPEPNLHGSRFPDFVIRRRDNTYLVVEIECPSKRLITSGCQLSAETTHAVTQAFDYANFLNERHGEVKNYFPNFSSPDCLVVIGLEGGLTEEQKSVLSLENKYRNGVKIVGFDWVIERAESIANNVINHQPEVKKVRMV